MKGILKILEKKEETANTQQHFMIHRLIISIGKMIQQNHLVPSDT